MKPKKQLKIDTSLKPPIPQFGNEVVQSPAFCIFGKITHDEHCNNFAIIEITS